MFCVYVCVYKYIYMGHLSRSKLPENWEETSKKEREREIIYGFMSGPIRA